jgi:hypothetical protein
MPIQTGLACNLMPNRMNSKTCGTLVYNSSFAPFIFSKALIPEELIRIEGVNRDGYIIFFQVI